MDDFFKDTICLATVAHDLEERANITDQQFHEGQIRAIEKVKILQTLDKIQCIPIVPRKIIEMIIEKCEKDERAVLWNAGVTDGVRQEATTIKEYAESLLKQFEEDK